MFAMQGANGSVRITLEEMNKLESMLRRLAMANIALIDAELSARNVANMSDREKVDILIGHLRPAQRKMRNG